MRMTEIHRMTQQKKENNRQTKQGKTTTERCHKKKSKDWTKHEIRTEHRKKKQKQKKTNTQQKDTNTQRTHKQAQMYRNHNINNNTSNNINNKPITTKKQPTEPPPPQKKKGGRRKGGRGRKLSHFSFCCAFRCCVVYSPCFPVWGEEKVMTIYDAGPLAAGPLCGLLNKKCAWYVYLFETRYESNLVCPNQSALINVSLWRKPL